MELKGDFTFDAPQALVWAAIQDPEVLGSVMPGGQGFEEIGEYEYTGALTVKVGPVQGVFNAAIKLSDVVAPESYTIAVDGKGAPGFVQATGGMKLEGRGEQTYMEYEGNAQIGGRIASVGQRLIDATAKSIVRQSLEGLNAYLKIQATQQQVSVVSEAASEAEELASAQLEQNVANNSSAKPPVPEYKPPSQTQVALNVMRDVFNDMVPPAYQPILIIGVLAIIAVLVWWLFS